MSDKLRFCFFVLFFLVISSAVIRKSLLCICKHLCFEVFVTFSLSPFSFAHPFVLQKVSSDPLLSKHWLSHLSFPLCLLVPIWLFFFGFFGCCFFFAPSRSDINMLELRGRYATVCPQRVCAVISVWSYIILQSFFSVNSWFVSK